MAVATIRVWDPFVRIFHWSLVVLFAIAYFTGEEESWVHEWSGYTILVLVAMRLVWSLVGSRRARFTDSLRSPAAAVRYLRDLATGHARRHLGHNPAGGWMVVALLLSVLATGSSGLVVAGLEGAGPLAGTIAADAWVVRLASPLAEGGEADTEEEHEEHADDDAYEEGYAAGEHEAGAREDPRGRSVAGEDRGLEAAEETWEEWHELAADFTVFLIVVHVLGVLASSLAHRENLVRAMITGRKRAG